MICIDKIYEMIYIISPQFPAGPIPCLHQLEETTQRKTKRKYKIPQSDNLTFKMMIDDVITLGQFGYIILHRLKDFVKTFFKNRIALSNDLRVGWSSESRLRLCNLRSINN